MFIKSIGIKGLLSFRDVNLEMRPLNVLIGPNASGKSNLVEIIALLQAVPRDLSGFVRRSGGIADWLWKGGYANGRGTDTTDTGEVEVIVEHPSGSLPLRYVLAVVERNQQFVISEERLENERPSRYYYTQPFQFFSVSGGHGRLAMNWRDEDSSLQYEDVHQRQTQTITPNDFNPAQSILQQRRDPTLYQEMNFVGSQFDAIRLYREWNLGRNSEIRRPQQTDSPTDFLEENFANLSLVLNNLSLGPAMSNIEQHLRRFYEMYEQIGVTINANTAQLSIREKGLNSAIPATRLSDGTLRFLALLSILCHPQPPPLVCVEEPELGLHPDVITIVAELLKSASERTQLIVTTHSERLIDELSDDPESVVVCERDPHAGTGTEFKRLSEDELSLWLERYQLGELWAKGQIGGVRW
jgi:predicted ATPase